MTTMPGIQLIPWDLSSYVVWLDGVEIGIVERMRPDYSSRWTFRNTEKGYFGGVSTREKAIAALIELATR